MDDQIPQMRAARNSDVYRFAFDEASSELRRILKTFEELCVEKYRVETLLEALKPQVGQAGNVTDRKHIKRTLHLPNCTVVTRLRVLTNLQ